ncbi:hypothetical protein BS47DRAFT_1369051 [Hydnum rufescens UP504]|uniref:Uncharacterized protein n=1 Tax=Hydnum rufescens UP504 TaxID=1448309 RepID=A0A9P6AE55_9AGAM|nr:hypothetical protein BS47DRAFT_1369051 [Hydnum rufescens UP504]
MYERDSTKNVDSTSSNDNSCVYSKSNNAILHWFPLADEVVEPTSPSTSHNSQSTLCPPSLSHEMSKRVKTPKLNPHMAIPHHVLSSQHDDVLYHATTHEYLFSSAPITTYQFLMVWMKFAPAQYNTTYFVYEEELQEWHMDQELLITVQTGIERLQNVISDIITIVGSEDHRFVIDCEGKLAEQLWMSKRIEELKMADKLLKLRVELTFAWLYKLKKLHQGESLSMPMASKDSLPPMPELKEHLRKAWHDPRLPTKRIARRALAAGWEVIKGDIEGTWPIIQAMRHLFSGNQALKYAEYDVNLEEALNIQPLLRVDTDPHGLGLFIQGSEFEEPSMGASLDPAHGPRAGPGSIINLPAWPTPPSDWTRLGNSSTFRASSIDLDTCHPLATSFYSWRGIEECSLDPSKAQNPNRELPGSWEMGPLVESMVGRYPSGDSLTLRPPGPSRTRLPLTNYLIGQANAMSRGDKYLGPAWDAVTDTPALLAPGATRAHNYYTNLVKMAPSSFSRTLFPLDPTNLPLSELEGPSIALSSSQGSSQKGSPNPPAGDPKGKNPQPPPPPHPDSSKEGGGGPPDNDGPGHGGGGPSPGIPPSGGPSGSGGPPGPPGPKKKKKKREGGELPQTHEIIALIEPVDRCVLIAIPFRHGFPL